MLQCDILKGLNMKLEKTFAKFTFKIKRIALLAIYTGGGGGGNPSL